MNLLGIGPLIALAGGLGAGIVLLLQHRFGIAWRAPAEWTFHMRGAAAVLITVGIYFWLGSAWRIAHQARAHTLITAGVYRLSRNPMYAAFIVFLVPGIALLINNLLLGVAALGMYAVFKLKIRKEEDYLRQEFGDAFAEYRQRVPQLMPFAGFHRARRGKAPKP